MITREAIIFLCFLKLQILGDEILYLYAMESIGANHDQILSKYINPGR